MNDKVNKGYITEERINQITKERFVETITDIASYLHQSEEQEGNAMISEDNFVNVFLPFFAGEENLYKVGLGNWITVATAHGYFPAGQFREVDVIGSDGKLLFSVPPIYDREAIKPVKISDRTSLPQLMEQADKLGMIKPKLRTDMQTDVLNVLLNKMHNGDNKAKEYLLRWDEIFKRYGRDSIFKVEKNIEGQSSDTGDDTTYEIEEL